MTGDKVDTAVGALSDSKLNFSLPHLPISRPRFKERTTSNSQSAQHSHHKHNSTHSYSNQNGSDPYARAVPELHAPTSAHFADSRRARSGRRQTRSEMAPSKPSIIKREMLREYSEGSSNPWHQDHLKRYSIFPSRRRQSRSSNDQSRNTHHHGRNAPLATPEENVAARERLRSEIDAQFEREAARYGMPHGCAFGPPHTQQTASLATEEEKLAACERVRFETDAQFRSEVARARINGISGERGPEPRQDILNNMPIWPPPLGTDRFSSRVEESSPNPAFFGRSPSSDPPSYTTQDRWPMTPTGVDTVGYRPPGQLVYPFNTAEEPNIPAPSYEESRHGRRMGQRINDVNSVIQSHRRQQTPAYYSNDGAYDAPASEYITQARNPNTRSIESIGFVYDNADSPIPSNSFVNRLVDESADSFVPPSVEDIYDNVSMTPSMRRSSLSMLFAILLWIQNTMNSIRIYSRVFRRFVAAKARTLPPTLWSGISHAARYIWTTYCKSPYRVVLDLQHRNWLLSPFVFFSKSPVGDFLIYRASMELWGIRPLLLWLQSIDWFGIFRSDNAGTDPGMHCSWLCFLCCGSCNTCADVLRDSMV